MQLTHLVLAARRNFFDIASKLPRRGVGQRISRKTWEDNSYWTVERVQVKLDGRHGKAYGVLTWRGKAAENVTRINGTLKPVWRHHDAAPNQAWKSVEKPALEPKSESQPETS